MEPNAPKSPNHTPESIKEERKKPEHTPEETPEIGGAKGPEPTRYGDWEHKGRVSDF